MGSEEVCENVSAWAATWPKVIGLGSWLPNTWHEFSAEFMMALRDERQEVISEEDETIDAEEMNICKKWSCYLANIRKG